MQYIREIAKRGFRATDGQSDVQFFCKCRTNHRRTARNIFVKVSLQSVEWFRSLFRTHRQTFYFIYIDTSGYPACVALPCVALFYVFHFLVLFIILIYYPVLVYFLYFLFHFLFTRFLRCSLLRFCSTSIIEKLKRLLLRFPYFYF